MASTRVGTITQQTTPSDHLKRDVSSVLSFLEPDLYPLDTMLRRMPEGEAAKAVMVEWGEQSHYPRQDAINHGGGYAAGGATAAVSWVVDNVSMWRVDDIIFLPAQPTAPIMVVESITTGTSTLSVRALGIRTGGNVGGFGTVPLVADDEVIVWLGNAKVEGGTYTAARSSMPYYTTNYCETSDQVVSISGTRKATANYTKNHSWTDAQKEQLKEFRRSLEYKAWFGDASETIDGTTGELRWTMKGITRFITKTLTYDRDSVDGSRITEVMLLNWMRDLFAGNNGSTSRIMFADSYLSTELAKVPLSGLRERKEVSLLGVKVEKIVFNLGTLYIKHHRGFNEMGLEHYGVAVDMESIERRTLRKMEKIPLALKSQGVDKYAEQYLEQSTLVVKNTPAHAIIQG